MQLLTTKKYIIVFIILLVSFYHKTYCQNPNQEIFDFNYEYSKFILDTSTSSIHLNGKILITNIGKKSLRIKRAHQNNDVSNVRPNFADKNWVVKPNESFEVVINSGTFYYENHYYKTPKSKLLDKEIVNQERVLPVSFIIYYCLVDSTIQVNDSCFKYYHRMKLKPSWLSY